MESIGIGLVLFFLFWCGVGVTYGIIYCITHFTVGFVLIVGSLAICILAARLFFKD